MKKDLDKESLEVWYQANKITADRIINDLRKQTYEAVMHIYAYTSRLLQLEHIVSQKDFPHLFSNHYTRVGDSISGIMALLIGEWNINIGKKTIDNTLSYWLACGNLYETLISKIIIKEQDAKERLLQNDFAELQQQLVVTSIANNIKPKKEWNFFFKIEKPKDNIEDPAEDREVETAIPVELQSKAAQAILHKAIEAGLCNEKYEWLYEHNLLAYFADYASERLHLSNAIQNGIPKVSWKPFETLFRIKGLSGYRNYYKNKSGILPEGHAIVDQIFQNKSI